MYARQLSHLYVGVSCLWDVALKRCLTANIGRIQRSGVSPLQAVSELHNRVPTLTNTRSCCDHEIML